MTTVEALQQERTNGCHSIQDQRVIVLPVPSSVVLNHCMLACQESDLQSRYSSIEHHPACMYMVVLDMHPSLSSHKVSHIPHLAHSVAAHLRQEVERV